MTQACDCKRDKFAWGGVSSILIPENEIFIFSISSLWCRGKNAALGSATQYIISQEISGKRTVECLSTKLPLPTLLDARYNMQQKTKSM